MLKKNGRGSADEVERRQFDTAIGTGTLDPKGLPSSILSGPVAQTLVRGAYPRNMSFGDFPVRAGLYDDESNIGIPGDVSIGFESQWKEIIGAVSTASRRAAAHVPARAPTKAAPSRLSPRGTPSEPASAPRNDAEFAAYAHRMTGDIHNLLPGYKRFRKFPHLSPAKEWVWYGRALYADRHRKSHPILNPTLAQKATMARNVNALLKKTPTTPLRTPAKLPTRAITRAPVRAPVRAPLSPTAPRKLSVRGIVGGALGSNTQVAVLPDATGAGTWELWHMATDAFHNDYYAIFHNYGGSSSTMSVTTTTPTWRTDNDSTADLVAGRSKLAAFAGGPVDRGTVTPTAWADGGAPAGSLPVAPSGGAGGGVVVNSIPGEEGQAVGAPLTPEEMAMDAAQPGSNIDPNTGLWVMGTTGPSAEYIMSHPSSVTPTDGSAAQSPYGQYPVDPATGMPYDPNTGYPVDPSTGQPYDPNTGYPIDPSAMYSAPPGYDPSMYGAPPFDPSAMYSAPPQGYDPSQMMADMQAQMQAQMDAMAQQQLNAQMDAYLAAQTDQGGDDGSLSPDEAMMKMMQQMMASQADDDGGFGDSDDTGAYDDGSAYADYGDDGSASSGSYGTGVYRGVNVGDMPGSELPEGMRQALQMGLYHELHHLRELAYANPHAGKAQDSIDHIVTQWDSLEDGSLSGEQLDRLGTAIMDWKHRYSRFAR